MLEYRRVADKCDWLRCFCFRHFPPLVGDVCWVSNRSKPKISWRVGCWIKNKFHIVFIFNWDGTINRNLFNPSQMLIQIYIGGSCCFRANCNEVPQIRQAACLGRSTTKCWRKTGWFRRTKSSPFCVFFGKVFWLTFTTMCFFCNVDLDFFHHRMIDFWCSMTSFFDMKRLYNYIPWNGDCLC